MDDDTLPLDVSHLDWMEGPTDEAAPLVSNASVPVTSEMQPPDIAESTAEGEPLASTGMPAPLDSATLAETSADQLASPSRYHYEDPFENNPLTTVVPLQADDQDE